MYTNFTNLPVAQTNKQQKKKLFLKKAFIFMAKYKNNEETLMENKI